MHCHERHSRSRAEQNPAILPNKPPQTLGADPESFCTAAYCRPIMTPIKALSWTLNSLPLAYGPHASTLC